MLGAEARMDRNTGPGEVQPVFFRFNIARFNQSVFQEPRDEKDTQPINKRLIRRDKTTTLSSHEIFPAAGLRIAFLHQKWTDLGRTETALCELPAKRGSKRRYVVGFTKK